MSELQRPRTSSSVIPPSGICNSDSDLHTSLIMALLPHLFQMCPPPATSDLTDLWIWPYDVLTKTSQCFLSPEPWQNPGQYPYTILSFIRPPQPHAIRTTQLSLSLILTFGLLQNLSVELYHLPWGVTVVFMGSFTYTR